MSQKFLLIYFFFLIKHENIKKSNFINFKLNLNSNMIFSLGFKNYYFFQMSTRVNYGFILVGSDFCEISTYH